MGCHPNVASFFAYRKLKIIFHPWGAASLPPMLSQKSKIILNHRKIKNYFELGCKPPVLKLAKKR